MRMVRRLALYVGLVVAFILVVAAALVAHTLGVLLVCSAVIVFSKEFHGISWNFGAPGG